MRLVQKVALLALPVATLAVTLSDFKSQSDTMNVSDLPPSCLRVYKSDISGCSPSDFTPNGCSTGCITALQSMREEVETACGDENLQGTGIITVFLRGNGPGAICPGAAASASSDSPDTNATESTEAASGTSSSRSSSRSSSLQEISSTARSMSSIASLSGTAIASSLAPTATEAGILVDTSSAVAPTSTSIADGAQSDGNDLSGQGSPFDTQGVLPGSAIAMATVSLTTMLLVIVTILHAAL